MFLHIIFSIFIMYYMALCESSEEKMSKCKHEHVCAQLCPTLCNLVAVACQAPLHMEFSRLEYWNGLPFPLPGNLPDLRNEPTSLASPILAGGFLTTALPGKVVKCAYSFYCSQVFRLFVVWGYIVMNILVVSIMYMSLCSAFLVVQLSHPYMTTNRKTIALTRWTFVDKVMSLLFNMLSGLVITFLARSKGLLISWLQSPSAVIFGAPQNKV